MIYNYIYRVTHSFLDFDASYTPIIHQETIASSVHPQYQTPTSETLVQYWIYHFGSLWGPLLALLGLFVAIGPIGGLDHNWLPLAWVCKTNKAVPT